MLKYLFISSFTQIALLNLICLKILILCNFRENATCGRNTCVQMYRHQWLLIWDDHLPHYPPVTFAAVEVPSHCECVNVGT